MKIPSMKDASQRARTFLNYLGEIVIRTLVTWGLFYTGRGRDLQCYFCGHIFIEWKDEDSAKYRHLQESPTCEHFQQTNRRESNDTESSPICTAHRGNETLCSPVPETMDHGTNPQSTSVSINRSAVKCEIRNRLLNSISSIPTNAIWPTEVRTGESRNHPENVPRRLECNQPSQPRSMPLPDLSQQERQLDLRTQEYGSLQPPQPRHSFLRDQLQQERQIDLSTREGRLTTFAEWPKNDIIKPEELAMAGFKYLGSDDRVQCVFCKGILKNWQQGDRALDEHRKFFNSCPYLESLGDGIVQRSGLILTENVTTQKQKPKPKVTESSLKAIGIVPTADNINLENMDTSSLGVVTARAKYPLHSVHERRVESFDSDEWKKQALSQTPNDFANAGLFYTGPKDRVRCFFCGGGMEEWSIHDTPIDEHKRWYPECPYLKQLDNETMHDLSSQLGASSLGAVDGEDKTTFPVKPEDTPEGKVLKEMGYDVTVINKTYEKLKQEGKKDIKASDLLDVIFQEEEQPIENGSQSVRENIYVNHPVAEDILPERNTKPDYEDEFRENKRLKEMYYCWVCKDKLAAMLYLPCRHLIHCQSCHSNSGIQKCSKCNGHIRGIKHTKAQ